MTKKIGLYHDLRKAKPWIVRWYGWPDLTTGRKKRYSKAFTNEHDARRFRAEKFIEFDDGKSRDREEQRSLHQLCSQWLKVKSRAAPKTVEGYRETIRRLMDYFGPDVPLSRITVSSADTFMAELKPLQGDTLSNWTRRKILKGCRAIFSKAVKWEWISKNPFSDVEAPKNLSIRPWHYLTPDEYTRLLDAAPSLRWKALYSLAYTAGLRFGEMFNLRWIDIDFGKSELTIQNHSATSQAPPFKVKNGKPRIVPLPKHTIDILNRLQRQLPRVPYVLLTERQYKGVVERWGKHTERTWQNRFMANNTLANFKRHIKAAGIEPTGTLSIHTLRKAAGKNWSDRITNPKVVQQLMGHASIATTMLYYNQITADDKKQAAACIDDLLRKSDAKGDATAQFGA